uniref:Eukaryotic translation initiation factor 3 subunit K n=3 Tax=Timema TaxID=61471 RepID=A0A7R9IJS6_9NEOP|nr:unnamed protein product [Timema bartmani]CAD7459480.1 unnamed protein product [Timema tahoe]CAD7588625.1 unnamed protein product [Timema genevievae]
MAEAMRQTVATMLKGIERYNPDNLPTLQRYVETQSRENAYDLEANLAVLKLYQFDPQTYNVEITSQILLKALTNFPHTDFVLCKCLLNEKRLMESPVDHIMYLADVLERCDFETFWNRVHSMPELCSRIVGFHDSIRKFVCHVVGITFQTVEKSVLAQLLGGVDDATVRHWVNKYGWREESNNLVFIANQDENIKTKNITEKIDFESSAAIMAALR